MSLAVLYDHHHHHIEKTIIFYFKFIHHGIKGYESVKCEPSSPMCQPYFVQFDCKF